MGPDDVLQHMRVEDGLYVLGCFERRVTFMSQQARALNLVHSLHEREIIPKDGAILVVGGSIAGMTAAAGAARLGYGVTLLEQRDVLLPLFRNNDTRWIHPYIYDWPVDEYWPASDEQRDWAQVPLLRWKAASAGEVARQIEAAWHALPECSRIEVHRSAKVTDLGQGARRDVRWKTKRNNRKTFDAVILAVGFGTERRGNGIPWVSYWQNEDLAQPSHEGHTRYLISGVGDGGLIDVLRVRLHDFRHEKILADFVSDPSLVTVKKKLVAIEHTAIARAQKQNGGALQYLYDAYEELTAPSVDAAIAKQLKEGVTVVLNGRDRNPFSLGASILNRFLVSRLYFAFDLEYRSGEFPKPGRIKDGFKVQFEIGEPEIFHRIICRHGPEPALEKGFPQVWKNCAATMHARAEFDQTRWPIYGETFAITTNRTERATATDAPSEDHCLKITTSSSKEYDMPVHSSGLAERSYGIKNSTIVPQLSGVSTSAQRIADERGPLWEMRLISSVINDEMRAMSDRRNDLRFGIANEPGLRLDDSSTVSWMKQQLNLILRVPENIQKLFDTAFPEAIGPRGVSGDPSKIVYVAKRIVGEYQRTLNWGIQCLCLQVDAEFSQLRSIAQLGANSILKGFDDWTQLIQEELRIESTEASPKREQVELTLALRFQDGFEDNFLAEVNRISPILIRRLRQNSRQPTNTSPEVLDIMNLCPNCHEYSLWSGTRCLNCGRMDDPSG